MSLGSVKDFYNGKTILVTGATGFIGRLMIAKLMRMGNLKEILMLSRPKKGKTNDERLRKILSGYLFKEMDKYDAKFLSKLRLVNGDMEIEGLGMADGDLEYIKNHVEIIVHGAATVRFDEELRKAITINIRGTKSVLDIAIECSKLQSFVHVSTAYSHCPRSEIGEMFYEPPMDFRFALQLLDLDESEVAPLTTKLIEPWPNTYTFTKAISEDMIRQYQDKLRIAIIRPSVGKPETQTICRAFISTNVRSVCSTLKDPEAGFTDTIMGLIGVGVGAALGLLRVFKINHDSVLDLVTSDIVVNSILTIACIISKTRNQTDKRIFNCCYRDVSGFSFGKF
jgi:alcohol-forming fatty acyl-CoA reductase